MYLLQRDKHHHLHQTGHPLQHQIAHRIIHPVLPGQALWEAVVDQWEEAVTAEAAAVADEGVNVWPYSKNYSDCQNRLTII